MSLWSRFLAHSLYASVRLSCTLRPTTADWLTCISVTYQYLLSLIQSSRAFASNLSSLSYRIDCHQLGGYMFTVSSPLSSTVTPSLVTPSSKLACNTNPSHHRLLYVTSSLPSPTRKNSGRSLTISIRPPYNSCSLFLPLCLTR